MKSTFNKLLLAVLAGSLISLSSCDKDDDPIVNTNTITDVVVKSANFSVLEEAVVKANLASTLSGAGPFTVFAPDNAAFASAGINSATVASLSSTQLSDLLLYLTIGSKILAASVPAGPNAKVTTAGGDSVFVTRNTSGVYINGIKVAVADINADNGVIHQLSKAKGIASAMTRLPTRLRLRMMGSPGLSPRVTEDGLGSLEGSAGPPARQVPRAFDRPRRCSTGTTEMLR